MVPQDRPLCNAGRTGGICAAKVSFTDKRTSITDVKKTSILTMCYKFRVIKSDQDLYFVVFVVVFYK